MGDMVMETDLLQLITTQGLAVGVTVYLIYWITNRFDKRLDELKEAIEKLNESVKTLIALLNKNNEEKE